jgi:hypothetical protein
VNLRILAKRRMSTVSIPASFVIDFFRTYKTGFVKDTCALGDAWESREVVDSTFSIFKDRIEYHYCGDISAMDQDALIGDIKKIILHEKMDLLVPMLPPISNCRCVRYFRHASALEVARATSRVMDRVRATGRRRYLRSYFDVYDRACFRACSRAVKNACGPVCKKDCVRIYVRMTHRVHETLKP